ncbi:MAG: hypothetical protein IJU92_00040 [Spirochaetaceae bacterium]|nr:hypothetical protein [Spirochaetaceae bacterium]
MKEKFVFIDEEKAHSLLERVRYMSPKHRGIDRQAYLFDDFAVLSTNRLKLRNVDVRDDDLCYFDDLIDRLFVLWKSGVNVVPILGYCYDPESVDGKGFLFMKRAKGSELYDDAIICRYEMWTQNLENVYLKSNADAAEYIVRRTHEISQIPQKHFNKFISDIMSILNNDILIDFQGKSNFFYDKNTGFQFIDLDSHTDNYYGLTKEIVSVEAWTSVGGFVPCHFGIGTKAFAPLALVYEAIQVIGEKDLKQLASDNLRIFDKCQSALKANDVPEKVIQKAIQRIKVFGQ